MKSSKKQRLEIAALAAKILALDEAANYHAAKKKAANQLGMPENKNLPTNIEIEEALLQYQQLFQGDSRQQQLLTQRQKAMQAMKLLAQYSPRLVGPLVSGTATGATEITLHLYSDHPEQVSLYLEENGIPNQYSEKHVRINASDVNVFPAIKFIADGSQFLLVIFSAKDRNMNPISSITNRPMQSLNLESLGELVDQQQAIDAGL